MTLADLCAAYIAKRAESGGYLSATQVEACGIEAVRYYLAWGEVASDTGLTASGVTSAVDLHAAEWAVIHPVFLLTCEREQAMMVEASRAMGVEAVGRTVAEVEADLTQARLQLQKEAYFEPVFSTGFE